MNIGIDARLYGSRQGGLGRYLEQLIKHLEQIDDNNDYVIFLRSENWKEFKPSKPNFRKVLADIPWYGWKEQLFLTNSIRKESVDLMHFPHWNIPLGYHKPFVVTIHDLLLLHYPTQQASTLGPVSYWFKNLAFRKVLNHAAQEARHIITPSEFTREDIYKTLGIPLQKISTTYLAPFAHSEPQPGNKNTPRAEATNTHVAPHPSLLTRFGITKPYVLYVGVAYPHKNLERLVAAWKLFTEKYGTEYQLVLVGKNNYFYSRILSSALVKQCPGIVYTDFVPDEELPNFYANARLYVMPSLFEGNALPSLEAMNYSIPVVSSKSTCLPEVLGAAAHYFDATSETSIAEAIYRGCTDENLRKNLISKGKELLLRYSWEKTAQKTLEIYEKGV